MLYLSQIGSLFSSLGNTFAYFAQEAVALNKFFEIMDTEADIKDYLGRGKIAVVTQEPLLFDVSIKDNISYGLKNAAEEDIIEVAKTCCVYDFISGLSDGYDTLIGEGACRLSQELKQRIAL